MKGIILRDLNQGPVYEEGLPLPEVKEGWKVMEVACAAINRRDIWITKGMYAGIRLPVILGSDGAGYVDGREVIINPGLDWGDNPRFQSKAFNILGMPEDGTFAEKVLVPESNIYPKPQHLDMATAAALPLAGVTAWRSLFTRGQLKQGERVLITGIGGGVAHLAMKFAIAAGAEVYVTSSNDKHLERALAYGARLGVNYKTDDAWDQTLKKQSMSFDLIVDSAGGPPYVKLVKLLDYGGRLVSYGGTLGPIPKLSPQIVFWKQLDLKGSTMGSPEDFQSMLAFVSQYKIIPDIGRVFPLSEGRNAFEFAAQGGHKKVVLDVQSS